MTLFRKGTIMVCDARGDGESPYLTRWTLIEARFGAIYLHKLHRSDPDEHRCHPWAFVSLILWRGYVEEIACSACGGTGWEERYTAPPERDACPACKADARVTYRRAWPGMLLFRRARHRHRIQLIQRWRSFSGYPGDGCYVPLPAWTLVFRGPDVREWGFFLRHGWPRRMQTEVDPFADE